MADLKLPTEDTPLPMDNSPLFLNPLVVLASMLLAGWLTYTTYRRQSLPPGPFPLPLVGNLPQLFVMAMMTSPRHVIPSLARRYGDIFTLEVGLCNVIFVTGANVLKEMFKETVEFSKRPFDKFPILQKFHKQIGPGIHLGNGQAWAELRRVLFQGITDRGIGPRSLEAKITDEVKAILSRLQQTEGQPCRMKEFLFLSTVNMMSHVYFGKRFSNDDDAFKKVLLHTRTSFIGTTRDIYTFPVIMFPWLRYFKAFMKIPDAQQKKLNDGDQYVEEMFAEHRSTFDPATPRDVVDLLINVEKQNKGNDQLEGPKVRRVVQESFATLGAAGGFLYWGLLYMAAHPEVQRKCQDELDQVVGRSRDVSLEDKDRLVYTEAACKEVLRISIGAPITSPHCARGAGKFRNYTISNDCFVIGAIAEANFDPRVFPEPEKFRPEHFITKDGKVDCENLFNFSIGSRICVGSELVQTFMFMVLTGIMHTYDVTAPTSPDLVDLVPEKGFIMAAKDQTLLFHRRGVERVEGRD